MAFQFLCPQGHLLQTDESMVGQYCKCPYCESEFVVPQPAGGAEQSGGPWEQDVSSPVFDEPAEQSVPLVRGGAGTDDPAALASIIPNPDVQPVLHLVCPQGHQLETPREMLGQDAMCPYCQTVFRLRFEDSLEYRRQKEEERLRREQKLGRAWLHWSIAAAVVVVLGVLLLIVLAAAG